MLFKKKGSTTLRHVMRRPAVNIVTVTRNRSQEQMGLSPFILPDYPLALRGGGGGRHRAEGKLRDGGVLPASMTPALQC